MTAPTPRPLEPTDTQSIENLATRGYTMIEIAHITHREPSTIRDYTLRNGITVKGTRIRKWGCDLKGCKCVFCGENPRQFNHHIGPDLTCEHCGIGLAEFQAEPVKCRGKG